MFSLDEILFDPEPHTYTYRGKLVDSVTQTIQLSGLGDDFSHVPEDRMTYARRRGNMVHAACHYYDDGDLDLETVDPKIRGYVDAYIKFRTEKPIKVIAVEKKMVTLDFGPYALAGTPDLVCWMDGRRVVVDRKTSQHMSKAMGLQTAGYKILWNVKNPKAPVSERYGLRLEITGKYKLVAHADPDDAAAFMDCLGAAASEKKMGRWRVKYGR